MPTRTRKSATTEPDRGGDASAEKGLTILYATVYNDRGQP